MKKAETAFIKICPSCVRNFLASFDLLSRLLDKIESKFKSKLYQKKYSHRYKEWMKRKSTEKVIFEN